MTGNCGECTRRWFCNENPKTCGAFPELPPPTNADRIRGMSDKELATLLSSAWNKCDYEDDDYDPAWLDWLQQPAETEDTPCG